MRPLSPLMRGVLEALAELRSAAHHVYSYPATPNAIAIQMGLDRDVPRHGSGAAARGGWSGYMAPSQRIIFPLTALYNRELIYQSSRPDGMSGTAYGLSEKGELALRNESLIEESK